MSAVNLPFSGSDTRKLSHGALQAPMATARSVTSCGSFSLPHRLGALVAAVARRCGTTGRWCGGGRACLCALGSFAISRSGGRLDFLREGVLGLLDRRLHLLRCILRGLLRPRAELAQALLHFLLGSRIANLLDQPLRLRLDFLTCSLEEVQQSLVPIFLVHDSLRAVLRPMTCCASTALPRRKQKLWSGVRIWPGTDCRLERWASYAGSRLARR